MGGEYTKIRIFQIKVNPGRREADPEAVHKLADSISEVGLMNPITVDQKYTLIAGLHRLEAAKRLGWADIECTVSNLEGLQIELAEIDENFVRKDLSDGEFRDLLLRRKEIYESLHPETKHGGDRKSEKIKCAKCTLDSAPSFIEDTAEKLNVHPATVRREIQTAKNLTPEAKNIIRDTKISKTNALKLSRLEPEQQKEAATQLVAGGIRSIDEYHPVPTEGTKEQTPEMPLEVKPPAPPPDPPAPPATEGCYTTFEDSVADLKNGGKDRTRTPDSFLMTFTFFLQRFCTGLANYDGSEYDAVLPLLTKSQLNQLHQEIQSVHTTLDNLFHKMERMAQK